MRGQRNYLRSYMWGRTLEQVIETWREAERQGR